MRILIATNHSYMFYRFRKELVEALMQEHEVILSTPFVGHEDDLQVMGLRCINTEIDRRSIDPFKDMLNVLNLMNFWFYGWATVGIIFVSSDLVSLLFGSTYVMDISIPIVLALNFYTVGMMNTIWNFKHTMGLFHYGRFVQFGTAALNVVFSIILGYYWGLFGILFATFLARLCTNLWYDPYAVYKFGFDKAPKAYLKKYLIYLLILSAAICFCWILCAHIHCAIWGQVVIKAAICSIIPNALFYHVFKKTDEYKTASAIIKRGIGLLKEKILRRP